MSDHQGESTLTVEHENRDLRSDDEAVPETAIVRVSVHTDPPPDIATLLDGANAGRTLDDDPIGIAVSVTNVLLSMFQALDTFDASTKMTIVHFRPATAKWTGTVDYDEVYSYEHHQSSSEDYQGGHAENESLLEVRNHVVGSADVDGQAPMGGSSDAPSWTLLTRSRTGEHYVANSSEHSSSSGDGCTSSESTVGTQEEHGFGAAEDYGVQVEIGSDGNWTVHGVLPGYAYDYELTKRSETHDSCDGDSPPTDVDYHDTGTAYGPGFTVSGHFDPAHPPTRLSGSDTSGSDALTTHKTTVALDYHAPVISPPR